MPLACTTAFPSIYTTMCQSIESLSSIRNTFAALVANSASVVVEKVNYYILLASLE